MHVEEDPYGINSTIESSPINEVRRIEEIILNIFNLAKSELATLYNSVCLEVARLKKLTQSM